MNQHSYDVVIIGGGITGLAGAYYLTEAGKKVLLLEKNEIGGGASGSCDDMIFLQSKKPGVMLTLALYSLELYRRLEKDLPLPLDLETRGGMVLVETPEQLKVMKNFVEQQQQLGLDVRFLEKDEMLKLQPHVSPHVLASTYSPLDSQVNPLKVMRAFAAVAGQKGLSVKKGAAPQEFRLTGERSWEIIATNGEKYTAETVLVAAGAWTPEVAKLVGVDVPIRPKRGQIAVTEQIPALGKTNVWSADYIVMKLDPNLSLGRPALLDELGIGLSLSQTHDGNYFIGGTREYAGFEKTTHFAALHLMIQEATRLIPLLKNVHIIRSFAGLRPASDDGKPFIGEVPGLPGFYLAAGHEGDGIALAPVTGKIIAQMITGSSLPDELQKDDLQELSPARLFLTPDTMRHSG